MSSKKTIYIIAAMLLWAMLGFIIGNLIEKNYIDNCLAQGKYAPFYEFFSISYCIHPIWHLILIIAGATGGYFIGQVWWRIVYIEKRHWRMKK